MKLKTWIYCIPLTAIFFSQAIAQTRSSWDSDTTRRRSFSRQEAEKGPHKGKMVMDNGLKLEMVTPSHGSEVSYFLYDSLNKLTKAKLYKGTVKYIFGGLNEFLEVNLNPATVTNQLIAKLEGWEEYKKAVVVLRLSNKMYTFYFFNSDMMPNSGQGNGQGSHGHHGHGGGHGRGGRQGSGGNGY